VQAPESKNVEPNQLLILADESANWKIAGLRQLDRLALAVNDFATQRSPASTIDVCVFWKASVPGEQRWLPESSRLTNCRFVSDLGPFAGGNPAGPALSTHLFIGRAGLANCVMELQSDDAEAPRLDEMQLWEKWESMYSRRLQANGRPTACEYVADQTQIAGCERRFLRSLTKSQDGFVSRFLNRPISRLVSRVLLKFPITPGAWTLAMVPLLLAMFPFLLRGHFIIGLAVLQIYSILDGCDGEIARAKYLESGRGRLLDTCCDVAGNLLLVIGLGFGLQERDQPASYHWPYALEGILCALFIAANELLSHALETEPETGAGALSGALYSRHTRLVAHSGLLLLGEKTVWWVAQLTKRDVATLFFLFLAVIGFPQWILHLSIVGAAVSLTLAVIARLNVRAAPRGTP
jgi:CDP-alcohol phosphatidyltransferase